MEILTQFMQHSFHNFLIKYDNPDIDFRVNQKTFEISNDSHFSQICYHFAPKNATIQITCGEYNLNLSVQKSGYSLFRGFKDVLQVLRKEKESIMIYPNSVQWDRAIETYCGFLLGEIIGESPAFIFVSNEDTVKVYTRTLFVENLEKLQINPQSDITEPYIIEKSMLEKIIEQFLLEFIKDISKSFEHIETSEEFISIINYLNTK